MNIFALSRVPSDCAKYHNNKHCSKMILEHTQLLCTTLNLLGVETPYKTVHKNHPCRLWTGLNRSNFLWLCHLTLCLGDEFEFRYNKIHKSIDVMKFCMGHYDKLALGNITDFALAMPDEYKVKCPVTSYRNYYRGAKSHLADWGVRGVPSWYVM